MENFAYIIIETIKVFLSRTNKFPEIKVFWHILNEILSNSLFPADKVHPTYHGPSEGSLGINYSCDYPVKVGATLLITTLSISVHRNAALLPREDHELWSQKKFYLESWLLHLFHVWS